MKNYKVELVCIAVAIVTLGFIFVTRQVPTNMALTKPAPVAAATKLPTEKVPMPQGVTAIKKGADKKLKALDVVMDDTKHVTATATLKPSKGGYDTYSVITDAGDSTIYSVEKPAPFFTFDNKLRVGAGYGLDTAEGETKRAIVEYQPFTLGGVSVSAELDGRSTALRGSGAYIGVKAMYEF